MSAHAERLWWAVLVFATSRDEYDASASDIGERAARELRALGVNMEKVAKEGEALYDLLHEQAEAQAFQD